MGCSNPDLTRIPQVVTAEHDADFRCGPYYPDGQTRRPQLNQPEALAREELQLNHSEALAREERDVFAFPRRARTVSRELL